MTAPTADPTVVRCVSLHANTAVDHCEDCRVCEDCDVTLARTEEGRLLCEVCRDAESAAALEAFLASGWRDRQPDLWPNRPRPV